MIDFQPTPNPAVITLWAIILSFALLFSALSLNRHAAFQSNGFDLGNVNQAIWNTAQGRPLAFTNMAPIDNRLALHVEPILLLFVPFYRLGLGGPEWLLMAQAGIVALGAWPLYLIARPRLGPGGAFIVCLAYLLYPALEAAVLYDFHAVTLASTFLLFAFYYLERANEYSPPGRINAEKDGQGKISVPAQLGGSSDWRWFALFALLAMACKEDMGLVVAMVGVYVFLAYRRWKPALVIFSAGLGWSLIAILVVQGSFGGNVQGGRYDWLAGAVTNPGLIRTHLMETAGLPAYLWGLFAPVGGLALLAPLALLPALPSLAINLLSSHGLTWRLEAFHYAAPVAPFVFIAAVHGLSRLCRVGEERRRRAGRTSVRFSPLLPLTPAPLLAFLLIASLTYHHFRGFTSLARPFQWREVTAHHRLGADMAAGIPAGIPLFAPLTLNPYASSRPVLHQEFETLLNGIAADDWVWLDVSALPNQNGVQQFIRDDLLPNYRVIQAEDGYLLLQPGASSEPIPEEFHTYARPDMSPLPQYALSVMFGDALELTGYDLIFNRAEEVQIRTYWQAHKPLPPGLAPTLFLLDEDGHYLGAGDEARAPATLVWFPTQFWPIGETMVVHFNSLNWHTRERGAYGLALGVSTSSDPWDVNARWLPTVIESQFAPYLTADGTVMELARLRQVAGIPAGGPSDRKMWQPIVRQRLTANFGGQLQLLGYDFPEVQAAENGVVVRLALLWQGLGPERGNYVRFVHIAGPEGRLLGQADSSPAGGTYPTSLWAEGEYVLETVEVTAGEVRLGTTLHIGLYDSLSGIRLVNERGQDHLEIPLATK